MIPSIVAALVALSPLAQAQEDDRPTFGPELPGTQAPADFFPDEEADDNTDSLSQNIDEAELTDEIIAEVKDPVRRDIEDMDSKLEKQKKRLEVRGMFESEWHEFNNLNFRRLDESSDQAILDSDDRGNFAFTGVSLELGYQADASTRIVVGTSYRGLWGADQIGNTNRFGGWLYFTGLYVEWKPQGWGYQPRVRLGRQRFDLGGQGGAREYIMGDILDMLRVDFPIPGIGTIITIPIDVFGLSIENDDVNFISFIGQSNRQLFGFRGERMTRRHGGVFVFNPDFAPELDVRTYGFYTHVGALGTGSDITYGGRLGNFSDRDWIGNFGVRAAYTIADIITPFASFDASVGIDRKELVANDVNTSGMAWSAGVIARKEKAAPKDWGIYGELSYFEAQGPVYQDNGMMYSHGYVSMKGRHAGGLIANRFLGWHPTAYMGAFGLENRPYDIQRKSGSRVIGAVTNVGMPGPFSVGAGYWFFQDTAVSLLNLNRLDDITPPFGYSREEFAAQERAGAVLGHEVNVTAGLQLSSVLRFYLQGGFMLPGDNMRIPVGRVAGTLLGHPDPATLWDVSAGATMRF